ncbi:complex I NDUFA9 subunit family protein [Aidingimonas halophila]|uniref:NADH dehydrogenase n=1 Tax=Aidingimonas halophila TaxID=574349 RepID=A0A1H3DKF3_9GAMM|nr:complex I NDUFA9 subunit family protein [Aidingimonas halophila]GHC29756.1 3-beta-hydroxy-Delta(5)-steroid dehydrogenase [Aidingimonas halophila]SDX66588.1 NADH dehydrogenase [Aidingimonas halophila]
MSDGLIVVFGGTGFLGRTIVRELADAGRRVRIAARHPWLPDWTDEDDHLELATVDIRDESSISAALADADGVINAVSLYVEGGELDFNTIHVQGAARLARLTHDANIDSLIHISGIGVDPQSSSAYVRARAQGETQVIKAFPKAVIARPSVLFGPSDTFLSTLASLSRLPFIPLFGDGSTRLQPVHVVDIARAIVRLVSDHPPEWRLFELGGGEIAEYRAIVKRVLVHLNRPRPLVPVPFPIWRILATVTSRLPNAPLTHDQIILMQQDNVVSDNVGTFSELGIEPRTLRESLPECLP